MVGLQSVALSPVLPARLSAAQRIDTLDGLARLRAWADAQEQHLLAAMAGPGDPPRSLGDAKLTDKQFVREEIACVLRLAPGTVNGRLHLAGELVRRLPDTLAAVERGTISLPYARCLAEAVNSLPDDAATVVELRVLPGAGRQTLRGFRDSVARAGRCWRWIRVPVSSSIRMPWRSGGCRPGWVSTGWVRCMRS